MEYIRRRFNTKELGLPEPYIRLYPLACWHIGAMECDLKFILEVVKTITNDPYARWVYLGDGGECTTKLSKGKIYEQTLSPQQQQDVLVDLLAPVKDKGLFGVRGNHGNRIDKETGLSFDKTLCNRLNIPYMGASTAFNLVVNEISYDLFFHHGVDSGTSLQTKINRAEHFTTFIDVDAYFTAHSHIAQELTPSALYYLDNNTLKVKTKMRHQFICGCAYDSRHGYAEDKGYRPLLPAHLSVNFSGRRGSIRTKEISLDAIKRSPGTYDTLDEATKILYGKFRHIILGRDLVEAGV